MREIFYYSFKIGWYTEPVSKWVLHDLKIPAYDVKEATITFLWHQNYGMKLDAKWMRKGAELILPEKSYIHSLIRQAIEWKVARKQGQFLVQYKKVRLIHVHEIMEKFK